MQIQDIPPIGYFVVLVWSASMLITWANRQAPTAIPQLLVLLATAAWYFGDVVLNDYGAYIEEVGESALQGAWLQLLLFIVSVHIFVPVMNGFVNSKHIGAESRFRKLLNGGVLQEERFQHELDILTRGVAVVWVALMAWAIYLLDFNAISLFFPYLGDRGNPWARGRVSSGMADSIFSLAINLHLFLAAFLGLVAAIGRGKTQRLALVLFFLTAPYFVFGRARNTMLAAILPAMAGWIVFRVRASLVAKVGLTAFAFALIAAWFGFVMANRSHLSISQAFSQLTSGSAEKSFDDPHAGLNMFKELGLINAFISAGTYSPNTGTRYFAELVNPIPRSLWPGKPFIGIDYAIARGQESNDELQAGVSTSVSTGMVGQGVVNFGTVAGPLAAAILISLWVCVLARQDLLSSDPGRFALYCVGCVITFNLGRDITLMTMYPFLFGWSVLAAHRRFFTQGLPIS